jgi:hypothetical protein
MIHPRGTADIRPSARSRASSTRDGDDCTLTMVLHVDLEKNAAIGVSETGEGRLIWLPRSRIAYSQTGKFWQARIGAPKLAVVEVTLPEWLAIKEGLV